MSNVVGARECWTQGINWNSGAGFSKFIRVDADVNYVARLCLWAERTCVQRPMHMRTEPVPVFTPEYADMWRYRLRFEYLFYSFKFLSATFNKCWMPIPTSSQSFVGCCQQSQSHTHTHTQHIVHAKRLLFPCSPHGVNMNVKWEILHVIIWKWKCIHMIVVRLAAVAMCCMVGNSQKNSFVANCMCENFYSLIYLYNENQVTEKQHNTVAPVLTPKCIYMQCWQRDTTHIRVRSHSFIVE